MTYLITGANKGEKSFVTFRAYAPSTFRNHPWQGAFKVYLSHRSLTRRFRGNLPAVAQSLLSSHYYMFSLTPCNLFPAPELAADIQAGIGKAMVANLLLRLATTVIATMRDASLDAREAMAHLPKGKGSNIIVVALDTASPLNSHGTLVVRLAEQGITHLDVVIANAGSASGFKLISDTSPEDLLYDFSINTVGLLQLFNTTWPLLDRSDVDNAAKRKFIYITSSVGSIAGLEQENFPGAAYGISKAGSNWLAKKIAVEYKSKGLKVGIIHPGWVRTLMGQTLANAIGCKEPPMTVEESSRQILEQVS